MRGPRYEIHESSCPGRRIAGWRRAGTQRSLVIVYGIDDVGSRC